LPLVTIDGDTSLENIRNTLSKHVDVLKNQGFVLHGVPVNIDQAEFVAEYLNELKIPMLVFVLEKREISIRQWSINEFPKLTDSESYSFDLELSQQHILAEISEIVASKIQLT
jgi:adenylate kinase family enzyme